MQQEIPKKKAVQNEGLKIVTDMAVTLSKILKEISETNRNTKETVDVYKRYYEYNVWQPEKNYLFYEYGSIKDLWD